MTIRSAHLRTALRFAGAVMLVSGLLLAADGALTLVWREPVTSLLAGRAQARLRGELDDLPRPRRAGDRLTREDVARLARDARHRARVGHAIGTIELPKPHRSYAIVEGTAAAELRQGPGHYPSAPYPGEGGTVAIAGHRTTYLAPFRTLDRLRRGDVVRVRMPYATFEYAVERRVVVRPTDLRVLRDVGHEQLVLTACHPLYSASHRLVAIARLRSIEPATANAGAA